MERENLYFIALIPDEQICREIDVFKSEVAARFEARQALKVMPHITLKTPFKMPTTYHHNLLDWFRSLYITVSSFQIELKNFEAFHNKHSPVIYVKPVINTPLIVLQNEIIRSFGTTYPKSGVNNIEKNFKPHITIAYRDLKPEKFPEAWKAYRTRIYEAYFEVKKFFLLQHDSRKWNIIQAYDI